MIREKPEGGPLDRNDFHKLAADERDLATRGHYRPSTAGGGARGGIVTDGLLRQATGRDQPPQSHRRRMLHLPRLQIRITWRVLVFVIFLVAEFFLLNARQYGPFIGLIVGYIGGTLWRARKNFRPRERQKKGNGGNYGTPVATPKSFGKSGWYQLRLLLGGGVVGWIIVLSTLLSVFIFPLIPVFVVIVVMLLLWLGVGPKSWKTWFLYRFRTKMFLTDQGFRFIVDPPMFWRQPDEGGFVEFEDLSGIEFDVPGDWFSQLCRFGKVVITTTGDEEYTTPVVRNAALAAAELKRIKDDVHRRQQATQAEEEAQIEESNESRLASLIAAGVAQALEAREQTKKEAKKKKKKKS